MLAYVADYWHSTLSPANRSLWNTYAAAVAMKNRLGETVYLTGFNHFIRSNADRLYSGETLVAAGPSVLALPERDTTTSATFSVASNLISFSFDNTLPWANEDDAYMKVYEGRPQIDTRNFFGGPWRWASHWEGSTPVPPVSPVDFSPPLAIALGHKVWLYSRISRADARLSEPTVILCTVTA